MSSGRESIKAAVGGFNFDNSYTRLPDSFYVRLNPVPVPSPRPRNHRVEESLEAAEKKGDLSAIKNLLSVLSMPFDLQTENADYQRPPSPSNKVHQTFCGT